MTASELTARVTATTAVCVLPLALGGVWLGGAAGVGGVLAGGALALFSFRMLARRATAATVATPWLVTSGLRFIVVAAVTAVLFARGWAHPLALLAGYSVLPVIVLAQGLRLARETTPWK